MADNRPPAYWEDDTLIVRCSALGGCLWELIAAAQDYAPLPPPDFLKEAFLAGQKLEPTILKYLEDNGWVLKDKQKEGHFRGASNVLVRYHPDAIGNSPANGSFYVIEAKAFGKDLFRRAQLHGVGSTIPEYNWQISVMMHAEHLPGMWVFYNKETGEVDFEEVQVAPIGIVTILEKVVKLVESLDDDLMERPCDDPKHFPCRYFHLRPEPGNGGVDDTLDVEAVGLEADFDQLAKEYITYKGMKDEAEKKLDAIKAELLAMRGSFRKAKSSRFQIRVDKGSRRNPNIKKMEDDGVDEKYLTKSEFDRLTVRGLDYER